MKKYILLLLVLLAAYPARAARTFYIDYSGGSNSNVGSKVSPWKSHPFMHCGPAPLYAHQPGDRFIFKGGITWPVACFQMNITAGGSSTASDYYGVDVTWYTGGSFTMPKFDQGQSIPTGNHVVLGASTFSGYTTFDTLEIANQGLQMGVGAFVDDAFNFIFVPGAMPGVVLTNLFIHDWVTHTDVHTLSGGNAWPSGAGSIVDGHNRILVDHVTISDTGGFVYNGATQVFGGSGGGCVNCKEVRYSTFADIGMACFTVTTCHDNIIHGVRQTLYDICPCRPHSQAIEDDFTADVSNPLVYKNILYNNHGGVTIYEPYHSEIYDNVLWDDAQPILIGAYVASDSAARVGHAFNNTVDCSNGGYCFRMEDKANALGSYFLQNNQWITNSSTPVCIHATGCGNIATILQSNNLTMSTATATAQGYNSSGTYAPTAASNSTVKAGAVLPYYTAFTSANTDILGVLRGSFPDIGAYQFSTTVANKPQPPSSVLAVVQ